jgi:PST family polysaccharide transporter
VSVYFGENRVEEGHGRKSLRGGAVVIIARALNALVQIGAILFLARLLSPEDYGLVSMVTAITGFATIFVDLGTRDAVVQRANITEGEVSALFWIVLAVGCGFSLLVMAAGPFIARFYGEPRLTTIAFVNSLTFVTLALTCQHQTLLRRVMKFRELAIIDVIANVISALMAIVMAFYGFGYWALVLRPIFANSFLAAGVWIRCRWVPVRPTMTPGVKEMLKFGGNLTGFTMADFAGRSSDRVAIGYRVGPAGLGHYTNALLVYDNMIDVVVAPLHGVAVASLSKLRGDLKELQRLWAKGLSTLTFYSMPTFGILAVTSQDLIVLLLGAKWKNSGVLLSIIALRGIPHVMERTLGWLHVTAGRTDRWMRWGLFALAAQGVALLCGLPFGPVGVACANVTCMFLLFVPAVAYAGRPLEIGARDVIRVVGRQLVGSIVCVGVGFLLRFTVLASMPGMLRIVVLGLVYAALYLVIVAGILGVRTPLKTAGSLVRDFLPARFAHLVPVAS